MVLIEKKEGIEIVRFNTDRINALNVEEIRPAILHMFDAPHTRAIIDLSGITYLDSSGFAMFLHLLRVARSNYCSFRFCGLTSPVKSLFGTLQLNTAFDIFPDMETCFDSYMRGGPV